VISVLIVEDDPLIAEAHQVYLGRLPGFTTAAVANTARDGMRLAAEAAASDSPIDLVLLDIGLPDIEGFDVARELAVDGPPPHVVLTSSREASSYGPRLAAGHALGFIPKDELSGAAIRALVNGA
jgi:DNA-binding NarL/FixJ family response regulator